MARFLSSALVALLALSFVTDSAAQGVQTGSVRAYAASLFLGVVLSLGYYFWK